MTTQAKLYAPKKADKAMICRIVDRYHVSTPMTEILDDLDDRMRDAMASKNLRYASPRTRPAWQRVAIKRHKVNRELFLRVANGALG